MKKVFILPFILATLVSVSFADSGSQKKVFEILRSRTKIKDPFALRDPFKIPAESKKFNKKGGKSALLAIQDGVVSDETSIAGVPLESIKIVGILMGHNRRAIAKLKGNRRGRRKSTGSFILKEGMKLGENHAELKAILPGGIVLVEKIKNIYDQEEYFETIIPLSNE